jgi:hypothetical protein
VAGGRWQVAGGRWQVDAVECSGMLCGSSSSSSSAAAAAAASSSSSSAAAAAAAAAAGCLRRACCSKAAHQEQVHCISQGRLACWRAACSTQCSQPAHLPSPADQGALPGLCAPLYRCAGTAPWCASPAAAAALASMPESMVKRPRWPCGLPLPCPLRPACCMVKVAVPSAALGSTAAVWSSAEGGAGGNFSALSARC